MYKKDGLSYWKNHLHPEDRENEKKLIQEKCYPYTFIFRIVKEDGSFVWFENFRSMFSHEDEEYIFNISRNITSEKKTEKSK